MARFSLPALALNREGVHVGDVARALNLTPSAVSMQLARHRRPHPALVAVVRALAGAETAAEISASLFEEVGA